MGRRGGKKKKQLWKEQAQTHFSFWESVGKVCPDQFLRQKLLQSGIPAFSRPRKKPTYK